MLRHMENYTGEGFYTYRSGDSTLTFLIEDGEVVSIISGFGRWAVNTWDYKLI